MHFWKYLQRQILEISHGGLGVATRKAGTVVRWLLDFLIGFPIVAVIRLVRPLILIRLHPLHNDRFGHLVLSAELYLCERDAGINVPDRRYIDISFFTTKIISNAQLEKMCQRVHQMGPSWLFRRAYRVNQCLPGGALYEAWNFNYTRDVPELLKTTPLHLRFTEDEESRGKAGLRAMGIPEGREFICFHARDSAYLPTLSPREDHRCNDYRNTNIQNYVLAAETLADRGYFVVRMGAVVISPINSSHPNVVDYATNGFRTDFMDMYLASKCFFYLASNSGIDAAAMMFRRPVAYVNYAPIGYFLHYFGVSIFITKQYMLLSEMRLLTLKEIFSRHVDLFFFSSEYKEHGVELIENTPAEIRDLAIEMLDRLKGVWCAQPGDDDLQCRFWSIYQMGRHDSYGRPIQGKFPAYHGAQFLRANAQWLD